ncbi:MAG TPA: cysteine hydrolase family protein [Pseudolabrys sp.]|jgi:nicotinamidase-related amidase|nr:cysteine hydrolase family protein [Pseudolabrys sp.]
MAIGTLGAATPLGNLEQSMNRISRLLCFAALLSGIAVLYTPSTMAQNVVDDWASIKAPQPPTLKPVTLDPKTTALLVMDLVKQACNEQNRPRCIASLPRIAKLVSAAREKGVMVIYTIFPSPAPNIPAPVIGDTLPAVAPKGDEPVIVSFVDKFILRDKDTGLEKMLKDKGITTVITVGTATHGAVLYTSSAASLRGFNVVVPVDGMSGNGQIAFDEQAVAYILTTAPIVSPKIALTRTDMINFGQ